MNIESIRQSVDQVRLLYHQLVLLVGPPDTGKSSLLQAVSASNGWPRVNVNLHVSEALLPLGVKSRATGLYGAMQDIVGASDLPILLDNLELLFDPALQQDPLRLLEGLSRNRPIIASWGSKVEGERLVYATVDHPEYRAYDTVGLVILDVSGC